MKYWDEKLKDEEFKKLNRLWKKKLKKSGFKDIELSEDELVRYSFHLTDAYRAGTLDYYLKAQDFLNTHKFKTECDQFIWSKHAEGMSCRKISAILESHPIYPPLTFVTVANRIRSIEAHMLQKSVLKPSVNPTNQNKQSGT